MSGPQTVYPPEGQSQLYRVRPQPQAATRNTRVNTLGSRLAGYGNTPTTIPLAPGHDQALFNPMYRADNLAQGSVLDIPNIDRNNEIRQQNLPHPIGPKPILNGLQGCYAAAVFLYLEKIKVFAIKFM